ncbi:MAG: site-specific DNA-methyltransferase [Methanobacteriota archaeon]|nr:MAG: site-specific DNA-methyltransferase [Euryarchaeota archaeon]|tara:strand:- start:20757 stop:21659 length:903 start_codon:yes stop_codon:yes gene_type:complete
MAGDSRGIGRTNTTTSDFGVSARESHDSSKFYQSNINKNLVNVREVGEIQNCPEELTNQIFCNDSSNLSFLPDNCIHLVVTSPPYNACKEYDNDLGLDEYLELLSEVFRESYRVLVPGGRAIINIANLGRKPYIPLSSYLNNIMNEIGFLMRGEIIWDKSASAGSSCAWGSFKSASNPCLRDVHEYILVFSKGNYKLSRSKDEIETRINTIEGDEFVRFTKSIWRFPTVSAKRIGHPAPFPVELPRRAIELYSFKGDIILDPFAGSGSTCVAAKKSGRKYIGVDINQDYCQLAMNRLHEL